MTGKVSSLAAVVIVLLVGQTTMVASPLGTAITYQGQLEDAGLPAEGTYNFQFALYDNAAGGDPLQPVLYLSDVTVSKGLFSVILDFGQAFGGEGRWLQISIMQPFGGGGAVLEPRQPITAAPYALYALNPGPQGPEGPQGPVGPQGPPGVSLWVLNGSAVYYAAGKVGVGTSSPTAPLEVAKTGSDGDAAIYAWSTVAGIGVWGDGGGVSGSVGVRGSGYASSGNQTGVQGEVASPTGRAIFGINDAATGSAVAVYGTTASPTGFGGYFVGQGYFSDNVGIGTTTPGSKLTVAGLIQSTSGGFKFPDGSVQTTASSGGGGLTLPYSGSTGTAWPSAAFTIGNAGSGPAIATSGNLVVGDVGNIGLAFSGHGEPEQDTGIGHPGNGILTFWTDAAERMRITDVGVGVGTTNPAGLLAIARAVSSPGPAFRIDTQVNPPVLGKWNTLKLDGTSIDASSSSALGTLGSPVYINANTDGDVVLAGGGGSVGIGTIAPHHRLRVSGGPAWTSAGWTGSLELDNTAAVGWNADAGGQRFGIGQSNGGLYFFRTVSDPGTTGSPPSYDMLISDTGNIGIGTTPTITSKLTVVESGGTGAAIGATGSIVGIDGSGSLYGVSGIATGSGTGCIGVAGSADAGYGVFGGATSGCGVKGNSTSGDGVLGSSSTGTGVYGMTGSNGSSGVMAYNGGSGVWAQLATGDRAAFLVGNVSINGTLFKTGGSFKIDHPLDPEHKYLYHSFVESPDMMNIYNGNVTTDAKGYATVTLPDWFEALNKDFRYQLTIIDSGDSDEFVQAKVVSEIQGNRFKIRTSQPNTEVSWQVTGVRQDAWANANRIPIEEVKPESEQGQYLHPEAFGQPKEKGMNYRHRRSLEHGGQ
jgi:hypothetical protein